jgi:hypothetical protein
LSSSDLEGLLDQVTIAAVLDKSDTILEFGAPSYPALMKKWLAFPLYREAAQKYRDAAQK